MHSMQFFMQIFHFRGAEMNLLQSSLPHGLRFVPFSGGLKKNCSNMRPHDTAKAAGSPAALASFLFRFYSSPSEPLRRLRRKTSHQC